MRVDDTGRAVADSLGDAGRFVACDVADKSQVESAVTSAVDHFGTLDVLINNAWGGAASVGSSTRLVSSCRAVSTSVSWGALGDERCPHRDEAEGLERIINMASLNGVNAHMGTLEYNSAKEALRAASRTAARSGVDWHHRQRDLPGRGRRRSDGSLPRIRNSRRRPTPAARWVAW